MVRDIADGLHVLVLRCGTGGFAFAAAQGGAASVTAVDSRRWASAAAVANADLNELGHCVSVETEDLLIFLEVSRQTLPERLWDLVVVDFPRTAPQSRRNHATLVANAARAVLPGGMLFIASHGRAWKSSDHLASHVESAVARGELGGRASLLRTCDDDVHSVDGPVRGVLCSVSRADSPPPARLPEASEPTSPRTASAVALGLATAAALERKA
jgi:23S rRNA G2069 N7-methylase RlmK/C1962 C5-methylase RlmI